QQADNGRKSVDYDGERAKLAARKFNDAVADLGNSNDYAVITEKSTNPETIAIEKDIGRRFGVKVNFSDDLDLAQQTMEVCTKAASFGHKLPDEIIFGKSSKDKSCSGLAVNQSNWKYIIIVSSGQQYPPIAGCKLQVVVDDSFKGTLYHEFGHINAKRCLHLPKLEEFSEKFRDQLSSAAEEITLARRRMDELRDATAQRNTLEEIMLLEDPQLKASLQPILSAMKAFLDGRPDSLGKKVAQQVSLYAASSPDEFMAEVYCGCMLGKVYDEEIMDEYKRLGGVPFE
ncbi:MAG: apolipoprotein A1/A4/E family protein, partial [Puniceicoccales bacterium]|nr:apolipoprotein A1/A4/E family protein [Puniceicoccales bacterium]